MKSKEEMWFEAYCASRAAGKMNSIAEEDANDALTRYKRRWPESVLAESIGSPVDMHVLQRAISQLSASNRHDAHLVMKSLYDAIKVAMAKGEQLTKWNPPPRGG